jgi:hypothetical protein
VSAARRTQALAALAAGLTAGAVALEFANVWRRGRAPLPAEAPDRVLESGLEAGRETVEVAVAGYRAATPRETALLNLLLSFALSGLVVRLSTHRIRATGRFGPFHDAHVGDRHIHHFIPGIALAFLAGGISIVVRDEQWDPYLAVPFGVGAALTLDEAALLVELEDVYWSEEGVLSVQVSLGAASMLGAALVGRRLLRRVERQTLTR